MVELIVGTDGEESHDRPGGGWPTSFVALYRSQYEPMVRLAYLMLGSRNVAEEVVQEAFVRVRSHLDRVEGPVGYLRVAVVNACRNQRRRASLERRISAQRVEEPTTPGFDELGDALAKLPHRQRAVLVMRYYLGMSEEEIADTLGCRRGTVKSSAHRGLLSLRGVLEL